MIEKTADEIALAARLTNVEASLFSFLYENMHRFVTLNEILAVVYNEQYPMPATGRVAISVHVTHLRDKIKDLGYAIEWRMGWRGGRRLVKVTP